jgi:hypothetical protein
MQDATCVWCISTSACVAMQQDGVGRDTDDMRPAGYTIVASVVLSQCNVWYNVAFVP